MRAFPCQFLSPIQGCPFNRKTDLDTLREDPQVPQMPLGFQLQNHGPPLLVPASLPFILAYCRGSAALSFSTKDPGFPSCNMEELDPVLSECPSSIDVPSLVIQNDSSVQGFQVSWARQISVYETCKAGALNPVTHLKL